MKLNIQKDVLLDGLNRVLPVVAARTTLPILSNLLLVARDKELTIHATDLDMTVSISVTAEVEVEGEITLPARRLGGIIKELPASAIQIKTDEAYHATIECGPSFFKIRGLPAEEYPSLPVIREEESITLTQKVLKDGLRKTFYAISTDETRYVLNGISATFRENLLTLVATDGKRLAMVESDVEVPSSLETDVIIPTKAVNELQRLLQEDGHVVIRMSDSQAAFELNRSVLVTKLIDGTYPNFRQVIPKETKYRVTLSRDQLASTVGRVALLAQDKLNSVRLIFENDTLTVTAQAADVGEARESMDAKYSGPRMASSYNPDFLLAPLRNLDSDEVHFDLLDEQSPGVIRTSGSFLYVIMPMRNNS